MTKSKKYRVYKSLPLVIEGCSHYFSGKHKPKFPMLCSGNLWYPGWEIPTIWAIDSNHRCWEQDSMGAYLLEVPPKKLLYLMETVIPTPKAAQEVRKTLGLKPKLPAWIKEALETGWTPPKGFRMRDYAG